MMMQKYDLFKVKKSIANYYGTEHYLFLSCKDGLIICQKFDSPRDTMNMPEDLADLGTVLSPNMPEYWRTVSAPRDRRQFYDDDLNNHAIKFGKIMGRRHDTTAMTFPTTVEEPLVTPMPAIEVTSHNDVTLKNEMLATNIEVIIQALQEIKSIITSVE